MQHPLQTIDQGSGSPVLLVHGFPLDHTMWRHQIESLRSGYRVIAPDLRGFGQSGIEPIAAKTGVSMAEYADDLAKLLDTMDVGEPVTFCGFSMGGYIGWQFFRRHRSKLRAMIMCDTKAAADTPKARETRFKMAENVEGWGSPHIARLMTPKLFAPGTLAANEKVVDEVSDVIARTHHVAIAAAQRGMAHRDDSSSLLRELDLPVMYVVGAEDQISPPDEMRAMADATPAGRFVEVPEAGHMSPLENPAAVTQAIQEFLDELD